MVTCCYLERENYKVLKFRVNNSSYPEISASSQWSHSPISAAAQSFEIKQQASRWLYSAAFGKIN